MTQRSEPDNRWKLLLRKNDVMICSKIWDFEKLTKSQKFRKTFERDSFFGTMSRTLDEDKLAILVCKITITTSNLQRNWPQKEKDKLVFGCWIDRWEWTYDAVQKRWRKQSQGSKYLRDFSQSASLPTVDYVELSQNSTWNRKTERCGVEVAVV